MCVIHVLTIHLITVETFMTIVISKHKGNLFFFFRCTAVITRFLYDCLFHCRCPQTAPGNYIKYFSVDFSAHTPLKAARGQWKSSSAEIRVCRGHFLTVLLDVDVRKLHKPFVYIYIIFLHRKKKTLQQP